MRAALSFLALLGLGFFAPAAFAQDVDGGTGVRPSDADGGVTGASADGGSSLTAVWSPDADAGPITAALPRDVTAGSEVAAGIDVAAASEVIHPDVMKDLVVSVREAGGVLFEGKTSVAVQFNPYILGRGNTLVYDEVLADRTFLPYRLLQDTAVSLALSPSTPYVGETFETGRFATLGYGISVDVLGSRSVYSQAYRDCLFDPGYQATTAAFIQTHTKPRNWDRLPNETDADYTTRHRNDPKLAAYDAAVLEQVARLRQHVQLCTSHFAPEKQKPALFVSLGERFVTPGPSRIEGDTLQVQRHFAAISGAGYLGDSFEFAGQVRAIADRANTGTPMNKWLDAALSASYTTTAFRLQVEAAQSFLTAGAPAASFAATFRVRFADGWTLHVGLKGDGQYVPDAVTHGSISFAVAYEEGELMRFPLPKNLMPK